MCRPKDQGGMGFQDLLAFNLALFAKQTRITFVTSFEGQIYDPMEPKVQLGISYVWRSLLQGFPLVMQGLRRHIGTAYL